MLRALSRIFQASPASVPASEPDQQHSTESDSEDDKGKHRGTDSGFALESGPSLLRKQPSSNLSIAMDRMRAPTPSHVSWKVPSPHPASTPEPAWSVQYEGHSASAPSLLLLNPVTGKSSPTRQDDSIRRHSSQSLRAHSPTSEDYDGQSSRDVWHKPHSSIERRERVQFPTVRRPSTDSMPRTPISPISTSTRAHDGHNFSAYPGAFINRPLNRSASQTSTSTFRSTASAAAPTIPPLDLRPDFQSTVTGIPPRKARLPLPVPTLPTVIGSPRPAKYSIIYEDGSSARTSSFITAPSEHAPEPEPDAAEEPRVIARNYAGSTASADVTPAVRTSGLPDGLYDVDLSDAHAPHTTQAASTQPLMPRRARLHSVSSSDTESYILQRWLKGVSFGSDRLAVPLVPAQHRRPAASAACLLFWLGFLGPWCWLIGGWMLSRGGSFSVADQRAGHVLPLWFRRRRTRRGKDVAMKPHAVKLWYPLVAPSLDSLAPSLESGASVVATRRLKREYGPRRDPWVRRCRIAAFTSGILLLAACVVAIVVVSTR